MDDIVDRMPQAKEEKLKRKKYLAAEGADAELAEFIQSIGEFVKRARRQARVTQEELAVRSGVDRSHISDVERGVNAPSLVVLFKLARGLGLCPAKLLCELGKRSARDQMD